jgi:hypothetical protein
VTNLYVRLTIYIAATAAALMAHRIPLCHAPRPGGGHLLRSSPVVGTADRSDLGMQWTLVRGQASRRVSVDSAEIARQEGSIP